MLPDSRYNFPTTIRFGVGRIRELPAACRELGMSAPLLVTDAALAKLEIVTQAIAACRDAGQRCEVFADVQANPVEANVNAGVAAFRSGKHDGVIAMGGGSGLDVGKAVALMSGQSRPLFDFEDRDDWWTRVDVRGIAPIVGVPTTAGTGSEVGRCSVITDTASRTKKLIFHPRLVPGIVIADPALHVGLPPALTAAVGMDALSHNLEAYCAPGFHPLADGIALEGMRLVYESLESAVKDGRDLDARGRMLLASTMGATAFQKGLGAMHSLSHPCGAVFNTQHGLTNAIVMPYVLRFNHEHVAERLTRAAAYLGLTNPGFTSFLDWVLDLRERIGIPNTLAALGLGPEHAAQLAPMALADPSTPTNPRPVSVADFERLYTDAILGRG